MKRVNLHRQYNAVNDEHKKPNDSSAEEVRPKDEVGNFPELSGFRSLAADRKNKKKRKE